MSLPNAPPAYDQGDQADLRTAVELADNQNRKKSHDIELGPKERLILRSPNGARWSITVSNAGVLGATAL